MAMPDAPPLEAMDSVTVLTPAYKETVIFSVGELAEEGSGGESLLDVLRRLYADEWRFFCERTGVARDVTIGDLQRKGGGADATAVRVWASLRGQTLCRTAFGMAEYEEALLLQAQAEQPGLSRPAALELVRTKFEMLVACQNYGEFKRNGEAPAADVELLLRALPGLRVVYHHKEKKGGGEAHAAVLIAGDGAGGVKRALARRAAGDADHRRGQAREPELGRCTPRPARDARRHEPGRLL